MKKFAIANLKQPKILGATLLSKEEAETLLPKRKRKYHSYWWLRTPSKKFSYIACDVEPDGFIGSGNGVTDETNAIRPALRINITSSNFKVGNTFMFGDKKFKILSPTLAFIYNDEIGHCAFRKDQNAEDANIYEASDVKKFVDAWFAKTKTE